MPGKTKKSIIKRFKITKHKKLIHRPQHQDHFKAKESGEKRREKRRTKRVKIATAKILLKKLTM
ncbi:MAG: 50S ribosomal protein L35 [Patescibacteria group bacterium]